MVSNEFGQSGVFSLTFRIQKAFSMVSHKFGQGAAFGSISSAPCARLREPVRHTELALTKPKLGFVLTYDPAHP